MGIVQRQGILNTIVVYAGILIGFINLLYVQPMFLKEEEIGLTRVLYSFSGILSVLMPLGAANILVRYFPQYKKDEEGHNGFLGFVLLYALVGFIFFSVILYLTRDIITSVYIKQSPLFAENFWFVFPLGLYLTFIQILNIYCFSLFKSVAPSIFSEIVVRALNILIVILYHYSYLTFDQFIQSFTYLYAVNLLLLVIYIYTISKPKLVFKPSFFGKENRVVMYRYGMVMTIAAIASLGLKSIDSIILAIYVLLKDVGIYSIALFIGLFIETPLNSLDRIASARMAAAISHNNQKEIKDIYHKSSNNLFLIGGLLFIGVNTCITPLFSFLKESYRGNELIVLVVSLGALFNMASGSNTSIIFNSEHHKKGIYILGGVFAFLVGLLFLLVPQYGTLGAAIAVSAGTFAYNFGKFAFIKKHYKMQPFSIDSLKLAILIGVVAAMGIYLPHLENAFVDILYRGSIVSISYLSIAYFWKIIPEELLKPARKYMPFINW